MEEISSEPMPGMRKICSVTMAPPNTAGICSAIRVTTGIIAFRITCFTMTVACLRPFAARLW